MTTTNDKEKERVPAITGFMSYSKAASILGEFLVTGQVSFAEDFKDALKLAQHALRMVEDAHRSAMHK